MDFKIALVLILSVLVTNYRGVCGENVLFLHTCSGYSHRVAHWPLVEGLLSKGHNVTFISPYFGKGSASNPKVHEIAPKDLQEFAKTYLEATFDIRFRTYGIIPPTSFIADLLCYNFCLAALESEEFQEWLKTGPKVDLIISDLVVDCAAGVAEKLGSKLILFSPTVMVSRHFEPYGIPRESHSVPDFDMTSPAPLSFYARTKFALLPLWFRMLDFVMHPWYTSLFKRSLQLTEFPNYYEVKEMTDLIMVNGDYITEYPKSWPPMVVKLEGIHVDRNAHKRKLSKEVENFVGNGDFVFISFGTVAKARDMPDSLHEIFFNAISSFKDLKFIWRWEGVKPKREIPGNLLLLDWVDQQALMAQPKLKAFLTHAGRPSTQEALFHGVPMITFPLFADQDFNANRYNHIGLTIPLDLVGLTEENLKAAVQSAVYDKKIKEKAVRFSKLAKDTQNDPKDVAVWWAEFVMRTRREELQLLKPLARNLYWWQKRDLDVWIFLALLFAGWCYLAKRVLKFLYTKMCKRKNSPSAKTSATTNKKKQ